MPWIENFQSASLNQALAAATGAYFLGCFATGYYLVRLRAGQDIRSLGSGSVGARNVGRVLGPAGFFVTLLGDFSKGALASWLVGRYVPSSWVVALAVLAVVAGHVWPVQLKLRGGKGIATSVGALAIYDVWLTLALIIPFGIAFLAGRFSWPGAHVDASQDGPVSGGRPKSRTVLPGLFAFICVPFIAKYLGHDPAEVTALSLVSVVILCAHRQNLANELWEWLQRRNFHLKPPH